MATSSSAKGRKFDTKGTFVCSRCGFSSPMYEFGTTCPFSSGLTFLEDTYIGRDPFSDKFKPLILGSHCIVCKRPVCIDQKCSLFYTRRYCIDCFTENIQKFPVELQKEISSQK